jgi:hypothetical protein
VDELYAEAEEFLRRTHSHWHADADAEEIVRGEWERHLLPALRLGAKRSQLPFDAYRARLRAAAIFLKNLYPALHAGSARERPADFWRHQVDFNPLHADAGTRRFRIDRGALLASAADYLGKPELRTHRLDWIFMDALMFRALDDYNRQMFHSFGGAGDNWSAGMAGSSGATYVALRVFFWVLRIFFGVALPFVLVRFLMNMDADGLYELVIAVWALAWGAWLFRWRKRRGAQTAYRERLQKMLAAYGLLGQSSISPAELKARLGAFTEAGVVLDGALFAIVDLVAARGAAPCELPQTA